VLLEVPIATSRAQPNYWVVLSDGLLVNGSGNDIVAAAVKALDAGPVWRPGVPAGFELSLDDTYFFGRVLTRVDRSNLLLSLPKQLNRLLRK
jgi:hypothetical protein